MKSWGMTSTVDVGMREDVRNSMHGLLDIRLRDYTGLMHRKLLVHNYHEMSHHCLPRILGQYPVF